jgi:low density lipoprotein receptor-related protein 5/6
LKPLNRRRAKRLVSGILLGATLLTLGGCAFLDDWFGATNNDYSIGKEEAASVLATQGEAAALYTELYVQDPGTAGGRVAEWLRQQPNVSRVSEEGDGIVSIEYTCGHVSALWPYTENGLPVASTSASQTQPLLPPARGTTSAQQATGLAVAPVSRKAVALVFADSDTWRPSGQLESALRSAGYTLEVFAGSSFTLQRIEHLGEYGVIYFHTHGAWFSGERATWIMTGEVATEESLARVGKDKSVETATLVQTKCASTSPTGPYFRVKGSFLSDRRVALDNALVLMWACSSFEEEDMADAFTHAGAAVYLGWSDKSFTLFAEPISVALLERLAVPGTTFSAARNSAQVTISYFFDRAYSIDEIFPCVVTEDCDGDCEYGFSFPQGNEELDPGDRVPPCRTYLLNFKYAGRVDDFVLVPRRGSPGMFVTTYGEREPGSIVWADLEGRGVKDLGDLGGLLTSPAGIALDVAAGKMYVVTGGNTVVRANLDGTAGESLGNLNGTLNMSLKIALDLVHGKMYTTNEGNSTVSVANLDGTGGRNLGNLNGTLNHPRGIALDVAAGKMYVTNAGADTVSRASLDGSGGEVSHPYVISPNGIALDIARGRMYVTSSDTSSENRIAEATLDGIRVKGFGDQEGSLVSPVAVALDLLHRNMYVLDVVNFSVFRTSLDGDGWAHFKCFGNLGGKLKMSWDIALWVEP